MFRRTDGSLHFDGFSDTIDVSASLRTISRRSGSIGEPVPFGQVRQVGLVGPPLAGVTIYVQLTDGRSIELGRAATDGLARAIADAVAATIGCPRGPLVRVSTPGQTENAAVDTVFVDVIQGFEDELAAPSASPSPPRTSAHRTEEVEVFQILGERCVPRSAPPADEVEEPATEIAALPRRAMSGITEAGLPSSRAAFRHCVEVACADLLDVCDS
ncbi:MAG: hypothetical protein IT384_16535 [Deltaproteobacteria bacterium]|nr:hypothetical protein [Deltaproteobacteria bacterium]